MDYRVHGYRHADYLYENLEEYSREWNEILDSIEAISDKMIIEEFEEEKREAKSISQAINRLMKAELTRRGWNAESYIFADEEYAKQAKGAWRRHHHSNKRFKSKGRIRQCLRNLRGLRSIPQTTRPHFARTFSNHRSGTSSRFRDSS